MVREWVQLALARERRLAAEAEARVSGLAVVLARERSAASGVCGNVDGGGVGAVVRMRQQSETRQLRRAVRADRRAACQVDLQRRLTTTKAKLSTERRKRRKLTKECGERRRRAAGRGCGGDGAGAGRAGRSSGARAGGAGVGGLCGCVGGDGDARGGGGGDGRGGGAGAASGRLGASSWRSPAWSR